MKVVSVGIACVADVPDQVARLNRASLVQRFRVCSHMRVDRYEAAAVADFHAVAVTRMGVERDNAARGRINARSLRRGKINAPVKILLSVESAPSEW